MICTFESKGSEATQSFAERLGRQLRGGEIIELIADIGAGKTTFVRGLACGIDSSDVVTSPTFTIRNVYQGRLTIYHYDLYRLHNDQLIKSELAEALEDDQAVIVLEWATEVKAILPHDCLKIAFSTSGEATRTLKVTVPSKYNYMDIA
ncbi:MAG: tRNA (adenosine(37)-N6)-threonylcarbamoyltransferase complex ATPase subunit type 1 TsaE [Candidatus Saccharimonadales bacterium]